MLQVEGIDAVVIATPHHWHAIPAILACEHGKDVYVEKPMALTVQRARAMVDAARRYGRVVQVGTQARSSRKFAYACRIIREGKIGRIDQIRIGCGNPPGRCTLPAQSVPDGLDWDLWVGASPWRPYHVDLYEHGGRYIHFGGGGVTDWGQHFFDVAQWALDMDGSGPIEIHPPDGKDRAFVTFRYGNGVEMILHMDKAGKRLSQGTDFLGTEGRIQTMAWDDYVHFEPQGLGRAYHAATRGGMSQGLCNAHIQNFLDCVRSRQRPNADVEIGCRSVTVAHVANIVLWANRSLRWDPARERFVDDEAANRYLDVACREPWHI
jgi:predicted dehydrogenase